MARIAAALEFRPTAQEEIKCMLHLLDPYVTFSSSVFSVRHVDIVSSLLLGRSINESFHGCSMMEAVAGDKLLLKDLKEVHDYLISINNTPEDILSDEQLQALLGELPGFRSFNADRQCNTILSLYSGEVVL